MSELVKKRSADQNGIPALVSSGVPDQLPSLIAQAGASASFAYEEFFFGKIRNPHTRRAYQFAVDRFLDWCCAEKIELHQIAPKHVGHYLDRMTLGPASKKLHLSALRHFFDDLVTRHAVILNPAATVRSERHQVIEGKTPEIPVEQARRLLASINTTTVVGLRDRAIIGILIYTAARVGAVARLARADFYDAGDQYCLRFTEKGGKSREIPVRHDLERFVLTYVNAAGINNDEKASPLFRSAIRRTDTLTTRSITAADMSRMVKRRMKDAGLPVRLSPHSFRVTTITDLLAQGVPLEDVQYLAGHADPRTTRLYDRRQRRVTRNIVERISI